MLGRLAEDEKTPAATQVPEKVIRRIGKIVDDSNNSPKTIKILGKFVDNAQKTPLTNMNQKDMNVSDSVNTAIRFEKILDGRNVAITIVSTKKSTLSLKSAWIINKKSGGRTPSANANAFAGTSKTNGRSSTKNSIPQTSQNSNPSSEKSSKNVDSGERSALADGKKVTSSEGARQGRV